MPKRNWAGLAEAIQLLSAQLRKPELMVFLPAATLAAFWFGGEKALILTALGAPLIFAIAGAFRFADPRSPPLPDGLIGLAMRSQVIAKMDAILREAPESGRATACFVVQFDHPKLMVDRFGRAAQTEILARCAERLCAVLREGDTVARLEGGGFAVALGPLRRLDLEVAV